MDLSWILLALFLVALIRSVIGSLGRSFIKNALRLGSVIVAFLITLVLQVCGVFQSITEIIVNAISGVIDLEELLGSLSGVADIAIALVSTMISMVFFIIAFLVIRGIIRLFIPLITRAIEGAIEKKAQAPKPAAAQPADEQSALTVETPELTEAVEAVETVEVAETAEAPEVAEVQAPKAAEAQAPVVEEKPTEEKKPKKKIKGYCHECAWKKAISIATAAISGLLVFAILFMPVFYTMSFALAATASLDDTDATDSQIYKLLDIADDNVIDSYKRSFVYGFYNALAIDDLMNYAAKTGGKITLDNGKVVYAADVIKVLLTHGVSAAMQLTSAESECEDVAEDVKAIVSNPAVSSILADLLISLIADIETDSAEDGDLMGGFVDNFIESYKEADKATIERDLVALGETIGVLAEKKIIAAFISGDAGVESILSDKELLSDTVAAISGLSAFGPTIEGAFELGIEILGQTLMIPTDDAAAYDIFISDLLDSMVKDKNATFDSSFNAAAYANYCITEGKPINSYKAFDTYVKHWKKVQAAFAHASEDKSYGSFTIEINGKTYLEDGGYIVEYTDAYKDKVSPIAGIINELTRTSANGRLSESDLYARLQAYLASPRAVGASAELARGILNPTTFVTKSVTVEKMMASTSFTDWTEEEKRNDSRLCVDIIVDLLDLMDSLGNMGDADGVDAAYDLVDQFVALGETMDTMKQTSCINGLPELLLEGLVKHDILSAYMKPSVVFAINDLVKNNDKSYAHCMGQIADQIRFAISTVGGDQK